MQSKLRRVTGWEVSREGTKVFWGRINFFRDFAPSREVLSLLLNAVLNAIEMLIPSEVNRIADDDWRRIEGLV